MIEEKRYRIKDKKSGAISLPFAGTIMLGYMYEIEFSNGDTLPINDYKFFIDDYELQYMANVGDWRTIEVQGLKEIREFEKKLKKMADQGMFAVNLEGKLND